MGRHGPWLVTLALSCLAGCAGDAGPLEPVESLAVEVTGRDYRWHYRYPGRDGALGTADDVRTSGRLHVPLGAQIELRLMSDDYIYSLAVPELGLKEVAAPDLSFSIEFSADREGRFALEGDQFCGYAHETLMTELVVETQAAFQTWLAGVG